MSFRLKLSGQKLTWEREPLSSRTAAPKCNYMFSNLDSQWYILQSRFSVEKYEQVLNALTD